MLNDLFMYLFQSVSGRNKCMCGSSHALLWMHAVVCIPQFFCLICWYAICACWLTRLIVSESQHWVTWSHRTGINFPLLRGEKNPILKSFCLTTSFLTHFYLWCKLDLRNWKFLFVFKTFSKETKIFLSYQICSLTRNLIFIGVR